jgi:hypothetical protein
MPSRASSVAFFVALLASALMLGPALAHAFELPAKIGLSREEYFVVQQIYRGWAGFAATANWTVQTDDWMRLRRMWEYSHLAGAGLQVLALACLIAAVMSRLPDRKRNYQTY